MSGEPNDPDDEDFPWIEGSLAFDGVASPAASLSRKALIKEVCRLIRLARSHWDAHNNAAARRVRSRSIALYESLTAAEREQVPQVLRVWLRYRSEKYYGSGKKKRP